MSVATLTCVSVFQLRHFGALLWHMLEAHATTPGGVTHLRFRLGKGCLALRFSMAGHWNPD